MNDDQIREVTDRADAIRESIAKQLQDAQGHEDDYLENLAREAWGLFHYATYLKATDEQRQKFLTVLLNELTFHNLGSGVVSIGGPLIFLAYEGVSSSASGVEKLTHLRTKQGFLSAHVSDLQARYAGYRLDSEYIWSISGAIQVYITWLKMSGLYQQSNVFYAIVSQTVELYLKDIQAAIFMDEEKRRVLYRVKEPFCLHSFDAYVNPFDLHYQEGEAVNYAF